MNCDHCLVHWQCHRFCWNLALKEESYHQIVCTQEEVHESELNHFYYGIRLPHFHFQPRMSEVVSHDIAQQLAATDPCLFEGEQHYLIIKVLVA